MFGQMHDAMSGIDQHAGRRLLFERLAMQTGTRLRGASPVRPFKASLARAESAKKLRQQPRPLPGLRGRLVDTGLAMQAPVGRDDVHVVRLQRLAGPDLDNRHGCPRRQDARQLAMAPRIEMDDDNEGGPMFAGSAWKKACNA